MKIEEEFSPHSATVEVILKSPWFGENSEDDYKELARQIKRHCDNVQNANVIKEVVYVSSNGERFDNKFDAMMDEVSYEGPWVSQSYRWSYYRRSDGFCKTTNNEIGIARIGNGGVSSSFKDLLLDASEHPHEFKVRCKLAEEEQHVLNHILAHFSAIREPLEPFPTDPSKCRF